MFISLVIHQNGQKPSNMHTHFFPQILITISWRYFHTIENISTWRG